jgi:hypothetical protein
MYPVFILIILLIWSETVFTAQAQVNFILCCYCGIQNKKSNHISTLMSLADIFHVDLPHTHTISVIRNNSECIESTHQMALTLSRPGEESVPYLSYGMVGSTLDLQNAFKEVSTKQ